jgi:hypothetical protein
MIITLNHSSLVCPLLQAEAAQADRQKQRIRAAINAMSGAGRSDITSLEGHSISRLQFAKTREAVSRGKVNSNCTGACVTKANLYHKQHAIVFDGVGRGRNQVSGPVAIVKSSGYTLCARLHDAE